MLEILKAIVLGVVEGITEWLPISSTGHMLLLNEFLKLDVSDEFLSLFMVVIQLGAIAAVVLLFWNRIWPLDTRIVGERIVRKKVRISGRKKLKKFRKPIKEYVVRWDILNMWARIIVACIPAVVIGLPFDDFFESIFYKPIPIALALIIFGIGFLVVETLNKGKRPRIKNVKSIGYSTALIIGVFQLIAAIFPGTSRSGATILGGLMLGVSRTAAAEFTFFMAIPVMLGASFLKVIKFMLGGYAMAGIEVAVLIFGMITAFIVSLLVIKFLMGYIKRNDFRPFGIYRIVLGVIVLIYFLLVG